jgi:hypothetical protein
LGQCPAAFLKFRLAGLCHETVKATSFLRWPTAPVANSHNWGQLTFGLEKKKAHPERSLCANQSRLKLRWDWRVNVWGLGTLVLLQERQTKSGSLKHMKSKNMSNGGTTNYYAYLGPLGQVVCEEVSFFASKDGFPIGTYNS